MAFERLGGFLGRVKDLVGPHRDFEGVSEDLIYKGNEPIISEPIREPTDYDQMMGDFSGHWGQTYESMEDLMKKVSHHESKGKNVYQTGGGPGAGYFQYETGAGQGGITARNRLAKWYGTQGKDSPEWLNQENMDTEGFDASKLNREQQKMLFMADKRYHPTASLTPEATSNMGDWWAKNHWAGGKEGSDVYNKRVSSFNRDLLDNVVTEQGSQAFKY